MRSLALTLAALALGSCCKEAPAPPAPPPTKLVPPLHDAQAGEWVRLASGVDARVIRVVAAQDYEVRVETLSYHNDAPIGTPVQQTWHRNGFSLDADCVVRAIESDRLEVGGRWIDCWRLDTFSRTAGGVERLYWISEEIPVHGFVKIANVVKGQIDDVHAVRLVDWSTRAK